MSTHRQNRRSTRRRLLCESLERRQLFAADVLAVPDASFDPEDINSDGIVSSSDALIIINELNWPHDRGPNSNFRGDVNRDGLITAVDALMVIHRLNQDEHSLRPSKPAPPALVHEIRSIDGTGNNLTDTELGSAGQPLQRVAAADYTDGISTPAGEDRPSAREISNVLVDSPFDTSGNDRDLSSFLYVWGQFIDHDIDLTETQVDGESFPIDVPAGDIDFDPTGTGTQQIPLTRSQFDASSGTSTDNPRQQLSFITAWIDGSMIYGSDEATTNDLRAFTGGQMRVGDDGLLPTDESGLFVAGDIRANDNTELLSMQTLFVKEHNRLAQEIATRQPQLSDEELFQWARAIVIAEIQAITYNEFLPALLGASAISDYHGYDASVDPTIANEFSTGAFRFGHSTVNDDVGFFDNQGRAVRDEVSLAEAFFNPSLLQESGLDATIKYIASSQSQEIDLQVVDSLRSFLFGQPGAGGLDLAALNIQRGRDHGLADYNSVRVAYGLAPVATFADITGDTDVQSKLQSLYGDVNNIDLWVGILAEDHLSGGSMGELGSTIIRDQFERLRDGDRLWYENVFTGNELRQLRNTSLADVIKRNTSITNLQDNVFFMRVDVSGTVVQSVAPNMPRSEVPRSEVPRFQMPRPEMPRPEMPRSETPTRNPSRPPQPITNSLPQLGNRTPPRDVPIAGITVELLNMDGEVIDSTVTDSSGFYHFDSIDETGDYSVRIESDPQWTTLSDDTHDFLVSNGATRIRGLNFRLRLS